MGVLAAAVWLGAGFAAAWPYTVDDAYVVTRIARRLAAGLGPTFDGAAPSDAVTGPLWLVPELAARWVAGATRAGGGARPVVARAAAAADADADADPAAPQKAAGAAAAALALLLAVGRARRSATGTLAAPVTAALGAAGPTFVVWSVAGLETGAAALALAAAFLAATARPAPRGALAGAAAAALAWLRPELVPAGLLACALPLPLSRTANARRAATLALALGVSGVVAVVAWRLLVFGAPAPLALAAKPASLAHGLAYVGRGGLLVSGVGGLWLAGVAAWRSPRSRGGAAVVGAAWAGVALGGGDWMPGFRLLAPTVPLLALLAGTGFARACAGRTRGPRRVAIAALVVALGVLVLDASAQLGPAREAGATRARAGAAVAAALREGRGRVALVDVGYLALRAELEVVDLGGITDREIAALPGGHLDKRVDEALLERRAPARLLLHSARPPEVAPDGTLRALAGFPVERRIAALPWTRARFRVTRVLRYTDVYWYVLLERREGPPGAGAGDGA